MTAEIHDLRPASARLPATDVGPPRSTGVDRKKPNPDWDALEVFYRAGYSLDQLSSMPEADGAHRSTIYKHAKKHGWTVDLTKEIQARARAMLVEGDEPVPVDASPERRQELFIEKAVKQHVDVAKAQRTRLQRAQAYMDWLGEKIEESMRTGIVDPLLSGGRDSLVDIVKKYVAMTQTLQGGGGERYAWSLDSKQDETTNFMPIIGRRDAPIPKKAEE
jgi:hypothetical protein